MRSGWEAAVGGGIPCIKALKEGVAANNVTYAAGILNGTCNFILTTMKETGRAFDDVLAEAQALGYAETPPDLDVDGIDTAHKLALVSAVSNGTLPAFDAVYTEGIRSIGAHSTFVHLQNRFFASTRRESDPWRWAQVITTWRRRTSSASRSSCSASPPRPTPAPSSSASTRR